MLYLKQSMANDFLIKRIFFINYTPYEVNDPVQFYQANEWLLSKDISYKKRKLLKHPNLTLSQEEISPFCLFKSERCLTRMVKA